MYLCNWFWFNFAVEIERNVYYFFLIASIDICIMTNNIIYFGKCQMCPQNQYVFCYWVVQSFVNVS